MLTRMRLLALVALGLGIMLGYLAASGQLNSLAKIWAEDKTTPTQVERDEYMAPVFARMASGGMERINHEDFAAR